MSYRVITPVSVEPVTLAEARLQCRLGSDETAEDSLLTALITVAREYAESETGKALAPQTLELALDEFPRNCDSFYEPIQLPMSPVQSVTSIKYDDLTGVEQTVDSSVWAFSLYGEARQVSLKYGHYWPINVQPKADAVRIQYVTGYATCPQAAKQAMLLLIGHWFENRQDVVIGDGRVTSIQVPRAADALLGTVQSWSR